MKSRTDKLLLAVFLLSLAAYAFLILTYQTFDFDLRWDTVRGWLLLTFHAVPAFCLQLLLCRRTRRWIAALPGLAVVWVAFWSAYAAFTSPFWDGLGYAILLVLCIAPAAEIALAWAAYGVQRFRQKRNVPAQ